MKPHYSKFHADCEWYFPHHTVIIPQDSRKVKRGFKLPPKFSVIRSTICLLVGPDLLQKLLHLEMRFQQHPFAVSADIENMFLQVDVKPCD